MAMVSVRSDKVAILKKLKETQLGEIKVLG